MSIISSITSALGLKPAASNNAPAGGLGIVGPPGSNPVHVRILGINDLHGQISDSPSEVDGTAIGGAATLTAYVNRERAANPNGTVLISAGDAIGAAPPVSTLLKHRSTWAVLAAMGLDLATFGNHEFDQGLGPILDAIRGTTEGKKKRGKGGNTGVAGKQGAQTTGQNWPGTPFPWVSANVVSKKTGKPILPPYEIRVINGVKVAFIGAVTADLKNVTVAKGIKSIKATDPVKAINKYIPEIQAKGVKAIVVFIHEGGSEKEGKPGKLEGPIVKIAKGLSDEVDAIMSAHSHKEYATKIDGKVVVQAGSYAKALGEIDFLVDPKSGQVVASTGKVIRNDEKGIAPDPTVAKMVKGFEQAVAPKTERVVSILPGPVTRKHSPAGETPLGTLIAEAQRQFAKADIAMMNPGGIRQDIDHGGAIKWGELFGVQPFANRVIKMQMTGTQIRAVLEQMFADMHDVKMLQLSGMTVHYDISKPEGKRITMVKMDDGSMMQPGKTYSVAANSFIADGGDGFTEFGKVKKKQDVGVDLDALVQYLKAGNPVPTKPIGRLQITGGTLPEPKH